MCRWSCLRVYKYYILILQCQLYKCCHDGNFINQPQPQSSITGESAEFYCAGGGTHLYWFINGVNTENMTTEEMTERGIQFSGDYNNNPPYSGNCTSQDSYLTMAGNCINNNTEIYCVILGNVPPPNGGNTTSGTATLTVTGNSAIIQEFNIIQTSTSSFFIRWSTIPLTSLNYTQSLTIVNNDNTTSNLVTSNGYTIHDDAMMSDDDNQFYWWYQVDNIDPCVKHVITLNIDTDTCSDRITTEQYIKGTPTLVTIVHVERQKWQFNHLIRLAVNSSVCPGSLPTSIRLVLLDNNGGDIYSSATIPWSQLAVITDGVYQTELNNVYLLDNNNYQLLVISESTFGQTLSDPFLLSEGTFDVTDVQYTLNNTELCLTCIFVNDSLALGCLVIIFKSQNFYTTTNILSTRIYRDSSNNDSNCIILLSDTSGYYIMTVYDWEQYGDMSDKPSVIKRNIFINVTTTTLSNLYNTSYDVCETQVALNIMFGVVYGLILILVVTVLTVLIITRKLSQRNKAPRNIEEMILVQTNTAYDTTRTNSEQINDRREYVDTTNNNNTSYTTYDVIEGDSVIISDRRDQEPSQPTNNNTANDTIGVVRDGEDDVNYDTMYDSIVEVRPNDGREDAVNNNATYDSLQPKDGRKDDSADSSDTCIYDEIDTIITTAMIKQQQQQ